MPIYPWPKHLIVAVDEVNDRARVTVIFPRKFPFRDKILTVVGDSVAVAQQIAWAQFAFSGRCNHHFVPDDDGTPGAGLCVKCLSRFDHILVDPATLNRTEDELTVQDILNEIAAVPPRITVYPTCRNPGNQRQHLAEDPIACDCHGRAKFRPGSFRDAADALREIAGTIGDDEYTNEEIHAATTKVSHLLDRTGTSFLGREVLRWGLQQLGRAPLS